MKNLVILCGGMSTRMGSDKALLKIGETTFVEHLYQQATGLFDRIIISIDTEEHAERIRELPLFKNLRPERYTDIFVLDKYEKAGPAGGILSVFEETDVDRFSVVPVDVPGADMRVLSALYDICRKGVCKLLLPKRAPEPLIAAYDRIAYDGIRESFESGQRKLRLIVPSKYTESVSEDELKCFDPSLAGTDIEKAFRNFNTQDELRGLYD